MSSIRRVYFYLVTIITLGIFAAGVGNLLSMIFASTVGPTVAETGRGDFGRQQLSLGLAMIIIGGPLWFFFWRAVQRRVQGNQDETGATARKLFLNFILLVTGLIALTTASNFLRWLMSGVPADRFSPGGLATLLVTASIWYYHRHVSEGEGHPSGGARTLRRWYVYILSGVALVWLSAGLVQLVNVAILMMPVWGAAIGPGTFWNDSSQMSVAFILLGGSVWWFHWFRMAGNDVDATLRQVFLYLLAILGSTVAGLVALTVSLNGLFAWVLGNVSDSATHFRFLGWSIPAILVTAAVWSYHQRLAMEEAARTRERNLSAQRVHSYLMSFLSLGTLIAGLIILIGIVLDLIINAASVSLAVDPGWWRSQLALSLALLLVGAPLWVYYWKEVLQRAVSGGLEEWRATSRRVFLYGIVVVAIIALAADLVNIVYQLLTGSFSGDFGVNVLRNSKWSIQSLIVAIPVLLYHWQIVRAEHRRGAEAAAARKSVVLLAGGAADDLASRIETRLGYKIGILYMIGQPEMERAALSDEQLEKAVAEVLAAPAARVMLLVTEGRIAVIPYREA